MSEFCELVRVTVIALCVVTCVQTVSAASVEIVKVLARKVIFNGGSIRSVTINGVAADDEADP